MPDHITYRQLGPSDLDLLLSVRDRLFDNPIIAAEAAAFLNDPLHEIVVALDGTEVVGFASGTVLLHPDKPPSFFVNEVGVREGWERQGIGKALMERLFAAARTRGCQGIWLGTEPDNLPALALYRSLAGDEVTFVGFGWDDAL